MQVVQVKISERLTGAFTSAQTSPAEQRELSRSPGTRQATVCTVASVINQSKYPLINHLVSEISQSALDCTSGARFLKLLKKI